MRMSCWISVQTTDRFAAAIATVVDRQQQGVERQHHASGELDQVLIRLLPFLPPRFAKSRALSAIPR
jgi:hypothetical protein